MFSRLITSMPEAGWTALVEAAGVVDPHIGVDAAIDQQLFELGPDFSTAATKAASLAVFRRALVHTHENVALKPGHG